jgi:hypothetical protein
MQPLKMIIEGSFFDSQLYSGRLYLWKTDGSIQIINWDKLIESITIQPRLRLAFECGFRQSDYLYGTQWDLIFKDEEIRSLITNKFIQLSQNPIEVSQSLLKNSEIRHQKNPIGFPHSDLLIYSNRLYVGTGDGIFSTTCYKENEYPVSTRPRKIMDAPVLGLSASYGSLSLSCGSDGLFEMSVKNKMKDRWNLNSDEDITDNKAHNLSELHSSSSRWTFQSIFSSSHHNSGYLADFERERDPHPSNYYSATRKFRRIISSEEIFAKSSYSWGHQDKLCQVRDRTITVVQFHPWDEENTFLPLGELQLRDFKGEVVTGDSALFGFIIECDNGIVVMDSNLENIWIPGEPVNWRIFSRSKFYENQLHIVYDDRLEIYSFNDDYFVNQETKKAGIKYYEHKGRSRNQNR